MEYAKYAGGFIKRQDHEHDWEACAESELPAGWLDEQATLEARKERIALGYGAESEFEGVLIEGNQPPPGGGEAALRDAIDKLLE